MSLRLRQLIKILEDESNKINEIPNNSEIDASWNNIERELLKDEKEFKLVHSVGSWGCYYYYISDLGRVLVVKTEQARKSFSNFEGLNENNSWFIPISNGYLSISILEDSLL